MGCACGLILAGTCGSAKYSSHTHTPVGPRARHHRRLTNGPSARPRVTMAALWNAVWSLIPWGSPTPHAVPQVGEQAPTAPALQGRPGIVAFPRHCGCPFATKEVLVLAQLTREHPDLHVVIVQHSPEEVTKDWFEAIGCVFL